MQTSGHVYTKHVYCLAEKASGVQQAYELWTPEASKLVRREAGAMLEKWDSL